MFAMTNKELGQTDLVEHSIELSDSTPIGTAPRRLPYALRSELEDELQKLLDIGCIEAFIQFICIRACTGTEKG